MDNYTTQIISSPTTICDCSMPIPTVKNINLSALQRGFDYGYDSTGGQIDRPAMPFAQNEWVFACVDIITRTARSIQMMLSTPDDTIVESGPAWDLLFKNEELSFTDFITYTIGHLSLTREVYWIFADLDLIKPTKILVAGPNRCKPVIRRGVLTGYKLQIEGQSIPLFIDDVHPLVDFNPYNDYTGVGPVTAGRFSISSSYQAAQFNEATLFNGGKIGNLITVPSRIEPEERQYLIGQFESRHRGARNAGRTCLMSGGADVKMMGQSMVDLQMLDLRGFDARAICTVFGVPPEIVGLNSEAQYAHGPAQQRFVCNTIESLLSYIAEHITGGILKRFRFTKNQYKAINPADSKTFCSRHKTLNARPSYRKHKLKAIQTSAGLFAWFNMEDHPTVREMARERAENVLKYTDSGIPLNQVIDANDLPYDTTEIPWGNDWWINMGQVPARFTLEAGLEGLTGTSLPEGVGEPEKILATDFTDHTDQEILNQSNQCQSVAKNILNEKTANREKTTQRVWQRWVNSWLPVEKEYESALRKLFLRQQRLLTTALKKAYQEFKVSHNSRTNTLISDDSCSFVAKKDVDSIVARVVFDLKTENGKLRVINNIFFDKASALGLSQAVNETQGLTGDDLADAVEPLKHLPKILAKRTISAAKLTRVNTTTQAMIERTLRAGLDNGETLSKLSDRIAATLGGNRSRANNIARTQTAGAISTGRHEGFKASGVAGKSWITSGDTQVRDTHKQAGSDYAQPIALDAPFIVGGEALSHPGDPAGSAGNIINCRCLEIARALAGKGFEPDYSRIKFITYSDLKFAA